MPEYVSGRVNGSSTGRRKPERLKRAQHDPDLVAGLLSMIGGCTIFPGAVQYSRARSFISPKRARITRRSVA